MDKELSRKKIVAVASIFGVGALLLSSRSLAYFTDRESASGVFTFGNVDVELKQEQRQVVDGVKTTTLEEFVENQELYPLAGKIQAFDSLKMPTTANYADKIVTVKNTKETKAWIRAFVAIPEVLDKDYTAFEGAGSALHLEYGKDASGNTTAGSEWDWGPEDRRHHFSSKMDGVFYHVYYADRLSPLAGGETSGRFIQGLYLDSNVEISDAGVLTLSGEELTGVTADSTINCPVFILAVQENGFEDGATAVDTAFGMFYNPWKKSSSNWQ